MKRQNLMLLFIVALLVIVPLVANPSAEYGGSDGNAQALISEMNPSFEPWFEPLWAPPSGEVESLLFTLLAVTGASIISYYLGTIRGKKT